MAVYHYTNIYAMRSSISGSLQSFNDNHTATTAQTPELEKLGRSINLNVFQELLDLDTPCEAFSKDIVSEFLVMGPELLSSMSESLLRVNLSQLNTSTQSLRCASLVLGLTRIEKACARIETILALGIDLHYTGVGLGQICEILSHAVRDAHSHFELARVAFSLYYDLPLSWSSEDVSDISDASIEA
ncbi:hypothetical protein E4T42_02635 [Aureobasidium subglaciale]|nr:hypothetical protein E4T42_02635 [Aureobasidium subglaciale]